MEMGSDISDITDRGSRGISRISDMASDSAWSIATSASLAMSGGVQRIICMKDWVMDVRRRISRTWRLGMSDRRRIICDGGI